jgi:hypothetical protein
MSTEDLLRGYQRDSAAGDSEFSHKTFLFTTAETKRREDTEKISFFFSVLSVSVVNSSELYDVHR